MEIKEMPSKCCAGFGGKHKKVFVILSILVLLAIVILSIAAASWKINRFGNYGRMHGFGPEFGGKMMNWRGTYPSAPENQFVLPQDAAKSGEIAIVVNDLEAAKKNVGQIALQSEGTVYATFIAYASNNLRNGSIVVQVPAEKFDSVFSELKGIAKEVVQESSTLVQPAIYYPLAASAEKAEAVSDAAQDVAANQSVSDSSAEIAKVSMPSIQEPVVQKNGYIKVIFVDYGKFSGEKNDFEKKGFWGNAVNIGSPSDQDLRNNILIIIGIKLILLVAIFGLLVAVFKKIFNRIRRGREKKQKVHIVRQLSKTNKRVVKIQPRKRK